MGRVVIPILLNTILASCLFGCASMNQVMRDPFSQPKTPIFPYKFYVVAPNAFLGPTPKDDLSVDACEKQGACIMIKSDDFYLLKADYLKTRLNLINLQLNP